MVKFNLENTLDLGMKVGLGLAMIGTGLASYGLFKENPSLRGANVGLYLGVIGLGCMTVFTLGKIPYLIGNLKYKQK